MMTDAQTNAWRGLVLATHSLEEALDRQSRRDGGIPHSHYKLLVFLYEGGEPGIPMSALAEQLQYSPSRLTHALASLERSGWARRERSLDDRRVQLASITPSGREIVRAVTPGQVREIREPVISEFSAAELALLARITERIVSVTSPASS
jgi:DNA-binding MarR family transcriptional regulator